MAFQYVDRVLHLEPWARVTGVKRAWRPGDRRLTPRGAAPLLEPAMILEAIAQLGGWLVMASSDFTRRPVPVLAEDVRYLAPVPADSRIDLAVEVLDHDEEVVTCRGVATLAGEPVVTAAVCKGYLVPVDELAAPDEVRGALKAKRAAWGDGLTEASGLMAVAPAPGALRFVDEVIERAPGVLARTRKLFAADDPLFADHFPRRPVLPAALMLSAMAETAQCLVAPPGADAPLVTVKGLRRLQCRKFGEPGKPCVTTVRVGSGVLAAPGDAALVEATVESDGRVVMRVQMDVVIDD